MNEYSHKRKHFSKSETEVLNEVLKIVITVKPVRILKAWSITYRVFLVKSKMKLVRVVLFFVLREKFPPPIFLK